MPLVSRLFTTSLPSRPPHSAPWLSACAPAPVVFDAVFDSVQWEWRDAVIRDVSGAVIFEQHVEFPVTWSQTAVNIVAQKYFRGALGAPDRENSLKQLITRVVRVIREQAAKDVTKEHDVLAEELAWIILHQKATFNSPVWFNAGVVANPQCSACFINSVEDSMASIMELAKTEARLFKGGSGTGTNLSAIRSSREPLGGGGTASGPVSFMRGFDAFAGAIKSGGKTRRAAKMVLLDDWHPDVREFIACKAVEEKKARVLIAAGYDANFNAPGGAYDTVAHQNANHSVRLSDAFMKCVERNELWSLRARSPSWGRGEVLESASAREMLDEIARAAWACGDPGVQFSDTINIWNPCQESGPIRASNPCSEYVFLDDTACNLASINLCAFLDQDGRFNCEELAHVVRVMITAMDAIVDLSGYPTEAIQLNSRKFRPLGLGYANLGALLMSLGHAYDSDGGREIAAGITSVIAAHAHLQSAALADRLGAMLAYAENHEHVLRVVGLHAAASNRRARVALEGAWTTSLGGELFQHAEDAWRAATKMIDYAGLRNAQLTVLAPTGTIGFMMDCDTTGIEPDIALIKHKSLVGGGSLRIVNRRVDVALRRMGYAPDEREEILGHLERTGNVAGCEILRPEDAAVFDCALTDSAGRQIAPSGHLAMMAAVQPFLSGAISKTVNMPNSATVEDVRDVFVRAWNLGLKAIAIYRDGCKSTQPVVAARPETRSDAPTEARAPTDGAAGTSDETSDGNAFDSLVYGTSVRHAADTVAGDPPGFTLADVARLSSTRPKDADPSEARTARIVRERLRRDLAKLARRAPRVDPAEPEVGAWRAPDSASLDRDDAPGEDAAPSSAADSIPIGAVPNSTEWAPPLAVRHRLPDERQSLTHKFAVGGHKGYVTVGLYEGGAPGEIFLRMAKEGSTLAGLMDAFATAVSIGLQHGVPLQVFSARFRGTRFDPAGFTGRESIRTATSVIDYLFRWLDEVFARVEENPLPAGIPATDTTRAGSDRVPVTPAIPSRPTRWTVRARAARETEKTRTASARDTPLTGPPCVACGAITSRAGSCYCCGNCGATTGCS